MKVKDKIREVDVAKPMVEYLKAIGYGVYQEVEIASGRADIIAVRGDILWIIEVKTSLSLALIEQAYNRVRVATAHYVSVAIPNSKLNSFAISLLKEKGIGVFVVDVELASRYSDGTYGEYSDCEYYGYMPIREKCKPVLNKCVNSKRLQYLKNSLCEEMKTYCNAGSAGGGQWTKFKATVESLKKIVRDNSGMTLREIVEKYGMFHYRTKYSAISSLDRYIRAGVIDEIAIDKGRLYYEHKSYQCDVIEYGYNFDLNKRRLLL